VTATPSWLEAVLVDVDGVLVDTSASVLELWRGLALQHGVSWDPERYRADIIGCAPEHTARALFPALRETGRLEVIEQVRVGERDLAFTPIPGAADALRRLHQAGCPIALVTSASAQRLRRITDEMAITELVERTVTWGEARGKPDPAPYLLAAARLDVRPGRCLVIEDAPAGVRSAVAAGTVCVAVGPQACDLLGEGAVHALGSIADLDLRSADFDVFGVLPDTSHPQG
jgi:sugar-phosphatase